MWRSNLVAGLRALQKNRTYAFINIFGLAIGLAACIVLLLYVRYELTYDDWLKDADRVYQVQLIHTDPETGVRTIQQESEGAAAAPLAKDFQQIDAVVRADGDRPVFLRDGEPVFADMLSADPQFFQVVSVPFLRGDPRHALDQANSLVMSRAEAIKQFGTDDVLGRTVTRIMRGEKVELRVTGVFEDLPRHSHMKFGLVTKIDPEDAASCTWGCVNGFVYLKLRPGASPDPITAGLPAWEKRNIPSRNVGGAMVSEGDDFDWRLVNVRDVHLSGASGGDPERPNNDRTTVVTFAVIALLILGIAVANFVNLATARAGQRAREVALRKLAGAARRQLIAQFLGESLLIVGLSMLIALALAELSLPYIAAYLGTDLHLVYLGADGVLLPILGLWLAVGLLGGLYPAFYLTRFQPGVILRSNRSAAEPPGTGKLRALLVVAQFAVSIGLIVCTLVVYSQIRFARSIDAGFRRDGLITVANLDRAVVVPLVDTLIREAQRLPAVRSAAATSIFPATGQTLNTDFSVEGRVKPITIGWYSVSPEFFETAGVGLLAGRLPSRANQMDATLLPVDADARKAIAQSYVDRGANIVVNRLAARQLGFADPEAAIGKTVRVNAFGAKNGLMPATIVGVVKDSRFRSLREQPEAVAYMNNGFYSRLLVHFEGAEPAVVRERLAQLWKRLVPTVPFEADYADAELAELYRVDQARGLSFAGFAGLAVAVACLGLFGLAAFTAERRTKEIGIRKVFGASIADIVRLLVWQFTKPVVIANLIAWPAAWWIMRDWLNQFDARIALTPGPFLLAGLIAFAIAIGTVAGHAIRIARTNPIHALRYE
ncbi:FtsX-like permease family protein [Sphingomonas sp. MAH-20]|uniref:FtsX-like permease family protein n=1 Tax=Sphingomonas horti TaxID=2682842 RepID=A0A6I4J1N1_9SPHN|nr:MULTISPECIES: ABC transporter permease [Sphingomonas]MBA2919650.1 ABC transporter permease [Sphingomonas sp. CGMCC 1.13658]MVO78530.1 FtsX-like permease family protein [Sphingomonas horti]